MGAARYQVQQVMSIGGLDLPVKIVWEARVNARASVGRQALLLRLPKPLAGTVPPDTWSWFSAWVERIQHEKPLVLAHLIPRSYHHGQFLEVGPRIYQIALQHETRQTASAKITSPGRIVIQLPLAWPAADVQRAIPTLLSRVIGQDFLPSLQARMGELNNQHFRVPLQALRLKANQSNWGSCSRQGNINLSTRLLFAPPEVVDYVIIHELAHRIEFNHSARFWELVAQACPNYREAEKWLKIHGARCRF